jgi:hypothetical protein
MELKTDISKLKALRADYYNQKADMEDIIHNYKETRKDLANLVTALSADWETVRAAYYDRGNWNPPPFEITLKEKVFTDKTEAGKSLETICAQMRKSNTETAEIGNFHGFKIELHKTPVTGEINAVICGEARRYVPFTMSAPHNLRKLETVLTTADKHLDSAKQSLYECDKNEKSAREFLKTPFKHENELKEKSARHDEISDRLNNEAAERIMEREKSAPETNYFNKDKRTALAAACAERGDGRGGKLPNAIVVPIPQKDEKDEPDIDMVGD